MILIGFFASVDYAVSLPSVITVADLDWLIVPSGGMSSG